MYLSQASRGYIINEPADQPTNLETTFSGLPAEDLGKISYAKLLRSSFSRSRNRLAGELIT
jgi:hypothetical protein